MNTLNEKGSALLVVLVMVTLLFMFGAVLATSAISGMKQTKLSERNIQAAHLAEMGVEQFRKSPAEVLGLTGPFYVTGKDPSSGGQSYFYEYENPVRDESTGAFSLTSVGNSFGKTQKIDVSGMFYDGNTPPCDGPYDPDCYLEGDQTVDHNLITGGSMTICDKANIEVIGGNLIIGEMLHLAHNAGGKNSSSLIVEQDAYFTEGLAMVQQNEVVIKGDAYFLNTNIDLNGDMINMNDCPPPIEGNSENTRNGSSSSNGNSNQGLLCVEGTLFYREGETLSNANNLPANQTCESLGPNQERGIWGRNFEAIPESGFPDIFKGFPLIMIEQIDYR